MFRTTGRPEELVEVTLEFSAMNTLVELLVYAPRRKADEAVAATHRIEALFASTEAALSRFRSESELRQLNRQGYLEEASEILYQNVAEACRMRELTGGIFNPAILDALEAAGYNRSFETLKDGGPQLFTPKPANPPITAPGEIRLDPVTRSITLSPGTRLDLGGIAKGSTVDRGAHLLREAGFNSFMIGAGGDMYLEGCPPQNEQGWVVGIQNEAPGFEGDIASLTVSHKAVATSAVTGRRWLLDGQTRHHLIDPRTGQPSDNGLAAVTAVANDVQTADVLAKTALILGPDETQRQNLKAKARLTALLFITLDGELIEL